MSMSLGRGFSKRIAAVVAGALLVAAGGCFNGGGGVHNSGVIGGGGRFALVIEPSRTAIEGTHFLIDTATGDLWRLESPRGESERWLRVSGGPTDVTELDLKDFVTGAESAPPEG